MNASAKGLFRQAVGPGIVVEERVFQAGPAEIEALFAGEVDFGYIGPSPALNGFSKSRGEALQIISGAASGGSGLVVRKGVEVASANDLDGRSVSVPQTGGSQDVSLRHWLSRAGLRGNDRGGSVRIVPFNNADAYGRMKDGSLDAAWVAEPWLSRMVHELGAQLVVDERSQWAQGRYTTAVVVVRRRFAEQNPDLVRRLLGAHQQSTKDLKTDPPGSLRRISERIATENAGKRLPDTIMQSAFDRIEFTEDPLRETILEFAQRAQALGYLREGKDGFDQLFHPLTPISKPTSPQSHEH